MKQLVVVALALLTCGALQSRGTAAPSPAYPPAASVLSPDGTAPGYWYCEENQQCMPPGVCTQYGGTPGTLLCSSGGRTCCTL